MENINAIDKAREMARQCLACIYANTAQPEQKGLAYKCVKDFPEAECPFWETYRVELRTFDGPRPSCVGGMVPAQTLRVETVPARVYGTAQA